MIEWLTYSSKALKGFPMGDPHERPFPVYLPPGYEPSPKAPYPVVYMLAGWSGRSAKYLNEENAFSLPLDQRFDRAIAAGRMPPFIAVFVDGFSKLGCSQYVNSPALGNYSDYICDELTAFIDERYPTHRSASFRAIAGHSSGGFGALVAGFTRPDRFEWICSSAGDSFNEVSLAALIVPTVEEVGRAGSIDRFVEKFLSHPNPLSQGRKSGEAMLALSLAPCYAPNLSRSSILGDPFFDLEMGAIIPEIWEKYKAWDAVHMADHYAGNVKKLKWVQLECGLSDEHGLQLGHRQIARKLKNLGVPHEVVEYPGGHSGHHWRFEERLTKILKKMSV